MRVVGECFFWYRLTRVFPDKFHRAVKRLCVCYAVTSIFLHLFLKPAVHIRSQIVTDSQQQFYNYRGSLLYAVADVNYDACVEDLMGSLLFAFSDWQTHLARRVVTHTHTQPFYSSLDFVWDFLGEPVPER